MDLAQREAMRQLGPYELGKELGRGATGTVCCPIANPIQRTLVSRSGGHPARCYVLASAAL